ncbi:lipopolysaccharide biosynthesis protein [Cloacibacillus evryensis]|uniref:lipopolysaccharide biosynthesis protein n=1 Tax=Cloacibacillus evryensis TaxID=508460 RepID=UPI0026E0B7D8|nr:hypothetical protein [Cloacibacillus evryensis]
MINEQTPSRTYNTITNSLFGVGASIITVALNFLVRVFLVRELGAEINGLHNLFQSVTNVVALMEMGFSSAMIMHLYKPIKEQDYQMTKSIMAFYRKVYLIIAVAFMTLCLFVDLFVLEHFVTTTIDMWNVRLYFALFAASFGLSYPTYHKTSILYAEQKNRIRSIATAVSELVFRGLQIVSIIAFHNYIIFLILLIFEKILANIICKIYVDRRHPYLNNYKMVEVDECIKKSILNTVRPLFISQTASTIQQSAKSILVSKLLGNVAIVGYFGNYQLVISATQLLFSQFGSAITSSFGNLAACGDKTRLYVAYRKTTFVMNWIAIILCAGYISCIQDFIRIIFGNSFVIGFSSVVLLTTEMCIYLFSIPIISIQNAMALHSKDKEIMILQAVIAIVTSYILGNIWGMPGILMGLLVPELTLTLINKGCVIYKTAFKKTSSLFIKLILIELTKAVVVITTCYYVSNIINTKSAMITLFLKGIIAIAICCILGLILSFRNPFFQEIICVVSARIRRIRK